MSRRAGDASPSTGGFYGFSPDPSTVTYHPVGNSPPVDLTEGRRLPPHPPRLLLLGCGDIRSVLHTAHVLYTSCPPAQLPTALHFHLNDIEAGVLARDLLLLRLASGQDACLPASEDAQFLWSVWYEALLGSRHAALLKDVLEDLCQEVSRGQGDDVTGPDSDVSQGQSGDVAGSGDDVREREGSDVAGSGDGSQGPSDDVERKPVDFRFGNDETRDAVKEALGEYSRLSVCTVDVFKGRNERIAEMNGSPDPVGQATERIASVFQEQQGCMKDPQLRMRCRKEIEDFVRTGMTSVPWSTHDEAELREGYTGNPTYFRPGSTTWCVHESACVFLSRDLDLSASGYDGEERTLSSLLFRQMAEHVTSFQKLQRQRGVKVTFTLWHGEALALSESVLPASLKFDFINTSNLADNVGLLNLLVMYGSSRLRPGSGLLSLQSFYWHNVDSLQEYLEKSMLVNPNVIQTVLGLKWGGDERTLNCRTFRLGTFVGREAFRFFFVSTPEPSEKIKLTGEDIITRAVLTLLDFCCRPRCPMLLYRPIVSGLRTYLHLVKNLSLRIEGGLKVFQKLSICTLMLSHDEVLLAMLPSFVGLAILHQNLRGEETEDEAVEVSLPVEVVGKEELHFCYIVLTPLKSLDETLMMIEISKVSPCRFTPCLAIIKDFTFDDRRKRVSFVLPAEAWEKIPPTVNACFENCAAGEECLLKMVPCMKTAASVRRLPRKQGEEEGSDQAADRGERATRRGLASLQLVEHRDSFTVSIQAAEGTALERLSVSGGESARHVQVTAGRGRGGLLWKAVLPCEVRADLSTAEVDEDDSSVELDIPKDEGELSSFPGDVRPVEARRLPSYQYDRRSELTLYLNFWRAFPSEGVHLGQDLWPHPLAPHVAARDLVLETSHAAIHRGAPLVVSVEEQDGDKVRHFLLLQVHGFKVLDDAPALIVTVLWPEEAITLIEAGKLRRRAFEAELHEMLRLPRYNIATTPLVQATIPGLVEQLARFGRQLVQDPHREASWLFQSCLRPLHSDLDNWIAHYSGVNQMVGFPEAFSNLLRGASFASGGKVGDYAWCCNREDYASMCLKCLLASGREFHHLQKNTGDGAKGMFSIGSLMTTFVIEEGAGREDARSCSYCRSRPDRLSECRGCREARYCCEQCQSRDWERHRKACASPSLPPYAPACAVELSQAPRADQAASGQPPTAEEARLDVPEEGMPESRHTLGGGRPKTCEASSVSWWKPGARVQSSAAAVRKPSAERGQAGAETAERGSGVRDHESQARDSRPPGKKTATAEDSSVSWWTAGAKVQSSAAAGPKPSRGTKPDARLSTSESESQEPQTTSSKAAGKDTGKEAGKNAGKATQEDSSVSWWKPASRGQRSGCQGSRPAGETRRPAAAAGVDRAPEIPDVMLKQAGIGRCDVCRKPTSAMKRCGRCKKRSYCSGDCQAQDWREHRKSCTALP